ncbi:unnamed protein product [Caenorhabditis nigoni]|uniref:SCP domain-containing protein n=1 Tax=Caenorhabditis nigoni TaxID=1611254 RepID=A0A2G5VC57_9PELO|nr:hypothetical protein B9Z55_007973 [Caenorhabditis nigoni]
MLSMKNLLVILSLALCLLADEEYEDSEAGNLKRINDFRREFAKKHNIANMHELSLDIGMRKAGMETDTSVPGWFNTPRPWRCTLTHQLFSHNNYKKGLKDFMELTDDEVKEEIKKEKSFYLELIIPKQKKIGCSTQRKLHASSSYHFCLFGPEGGTESYFEERGTPGSKCDPGYYSNDGLCSLYNNKIHGNVNGTMEKAENSGPCNFSFFMITAFFSMIMIF